MCVLCHMRHVKATLPGLNPNNLSRHRLAPPLQPYIRDQRPASPLALKHSIMQLFPWLALSKFLLGNLFSMRFVETLSFPLFLFHTFIFFSIYFVFNKILLRKDSYLPCTATALTPCYNWCQTKLGCYSQVQAGCNASQMLEKSKITNSD